MNAAIERRRPSPVGLLRFVIIVALSAVFVFPVVWIVSGSLKLPQDVFSIPVQWIPSPVVWQNYPDAWGLGNFTRSLFNSIVVTGTQVVINVTVGVLAGYGFAKFSFPGKEVLFVAFLAMTILPLQVIMIPLFLIIKELGWIDTYPGLIVPTAVSAFGVFMMRQFIASLPDDYVDAARVDGARELTILWRIIVPLASPAIVTLAVLTALASWDEFLWPLIVVSNKDLATMPLAISYLKSLYQAPANSLLAVAVVMTLPLLVVFLLAQRRILESIGRTGIRG